MRNYFDQQLALLNEEMTQMGALCEEAISAASEALPGPVVIWVITSYPALVNSSSKSLSCRFARFCPAKGFMINSIFFITYLVLSSLSGHLGR